MIFSLFRGRGGNAAIIDRLYMAVAEPARHPAFYTAFGVPDTVEGRFDLLVVHAVVLLRRLHALPAPAGEVAKDLVDAVFAQFDSALRELGVGDISVPKRMKDMAAAFYGRARAYEAALAADGGAVTTALHRNVYGHAPGRDRQSAALAAYLTSAVAAFDGVDLDTILSGRLPFPDPQTFTPEDVT